MRFLHLLVLPFFLLLGGCAFTDPDQARICRLVLPAMHAGDPLITVDSLGSGKQSDSIHIRYRATNEEGRETKHQVLCGFAGGRFSRQRQELAALTVDGDRFGEARLQLLKRFWLQDPASTLATPALSEAELKSLPHLPHGWAVALQHVVSALPQIAIYALLAPAYALIYGLTGRINLAFGELAIIGGQGALIGAIAGAMAGAGAPPLVLIGGFMLALAAAATHGELLARRVFLRLAGSGGQPVLVASIGCAIGVMEYVRLAQGDGNRWSPPLLNAPVMLARSADSRIGDFVVTMTEGAIAATVLSLSAAILLVLMMQWSAYGRRWRATAEEPLAASLFGIDPKATLLQAFMITSLLAGLAGFIMTAHYGGIGFSGGLAIGLKALVAAIAGGIGSVGGAVLGALLIGGFEALWSALFPLEYAELAVYSVLILLLTLRPGGLLGFGDGTPRRV
ncbi:MAG: branched-chain amino acid ABC transporter permease [Beijerinckiaceae bacterium]